MRVPLSRYNKQINLDKVQAKTAESRTSRKLSVRLSYLPVDGQIAAGYGAPFVLAPLLLLCCSLYQARKSVIHSAEGDHGLRHCKTQNRRGREWHPAKMRLNRWELMKAWHAHKQSGQLAAS